MSSGTFERARSAEAKATREAAILASATELAIEHGVRAVTLTDIAAGVGMHKSTMLRYFETREEIFLRLAAAEWQGWSTDAVSALGTLPPDAAPHRLAEVIAMTLARRPLFCELLAHVPLNLERGVSFEAVRTFKLIAIAAVDLVANMLVRFAIPDPAAHEIVATATAMGGSLWQMAAPGTALRTFYEQDPALSHAVVDVAPRLTGIISAMISGYRHPGAAAVPSTQ